VADVRPFRAQRYAPNLDLAAAICPPFDIISPERQRALQDSSPYNAVHIELADNSGGQRYEHAAETLDRWLKDGTLAQDPAPAFYVYDQIFDHEDATYTRRALFARLRLEPWEKGIVLPHEQTFGGPKEDRLKLLRAIQTNTSPVFLLYRDRSTEIGALLNNAANREPMFDFASDGQRHILRRIDDPGLTAAINRAFAAETLYVADGHHRYETALAYRDERRAAASNWTGREPENFALVALTAAGDPGLVVLPIHRVTSAGVAHDEAMRRLDEGLFTSNETHGRFTLFSGETDLPCGLDVRDAAAVEALLPQDRSPAWRRLDYAIANYAILRHALGLSEEQMFDYGTLWFTEDAAEALRDVREGRARYAVIMNPVPVGQVLDVADTGERMPQKSTFFYPKLPTGLVFNPLDS